MTVRMTPAHCAFCGHLCTAATNIGQGGQQAMPEDGDATICGGCGEFNVFTATFQLRKPTVKELEELANTPGAVAAQEYVKTHRGTGKGPRASSHE